MTIFEYNNEKGVYIMSILTIKNLSKNRSNMILMLFQLVILPTQMKGV